MSLSSNCEKKTFEDKTLARARAVEINEENREKGDDTRLRAYFCRDCKKYHLSSMTKEEFKKYDPLVKAERRKNHRIRVESEYWENKFGII